MLYQNDQDANKENCHVNVNLFLFSLRCSSSKMYSFISTALIQYIIQCTVIQYFSLSKKYQL